MIQPELSEIRQVVADDLEKVDERIISHTSSEFEFIDELIQYIIKGGKRIRPLLLVLSAKLAGKHGSRIVYDFAALIELVHIASLLHDDVIDKAELRRGKESVNSKWGIKIAVLLGDFLNAKILEILNQYSDEYVMSIISDTVKSMCEGEILHTRQNENFNLSKADYIEIVTMKTGKLIAASSLIGAHIARSTNLNAYGKYGINLGIAFQITDDLLDLQGEKEMLGKLPFSDLREGKLSYPYIYLKERCDRNELAKLKRIMMSSCVDDEIQWIIDLMEKYKVKKKCASVAEKYANEAKLTLAPFPDSDAKVALQKLADYATSRER